MGKFGLACSDGDCQRCATDEPRRLEVIPARTIDVWPMPSRERMIEIATEAGGYVIGPYTYHVPSRIVHID